jgi:hypothetical protein
MIDPETLKTIATVFTAIFSIWFKEWFVAQRTKRLLRQVLWKELLSEAQNASAHIESFRNTKKIIDRDGVCIFVSQMDTGCKEVAKRLIEIDQEYAYTYSKLVGSAATFLEFSNSFSKLINELAKSNNPPPTLRTAVNKNLLALNYEAIKFGHVCSTTLEELAPHMGKKSMEEARRAKDAVAAAQTLLDRYIQEDQQQLKTAA